MPTDARSSVIGPAWRRWPAIALAVTPLLAPYLLLLLLALGTGWTFPHLLPDRIDLGPIRRLLSERDGLLRAIGTSLVLSLTVGVIATLGGLLIGRSVRKAGSGALRFLMYVPFIVSPVVIGVCLYDLFVRLRLSGTIVGVGLAQSIVAMSFAAVFFSESWTERTDRRELLVRQLGGGCGAVWRHAVLPHLSGLILVCFVQAALYSWIDYGLASILGGGHVPTVTIRLFACIREASVNQAAVSSLVLLAPPLTGIFVCAAVIRRRGFAGAPVQPTARPTPGTGQTQRRVAPGPPLS